MSHWMVDMLLLIGFGGWAMIWMVGEKKQKLTDSAK